jgi:DNA-binding beta-propeller fold protein YncE
MLRPGSAAALAAACALLAACGPPAVVMIGRPGLGDGEFREPRAVAASEHGLAVLDKSGRLQLFELDGTFRSSFRVTAEDVRRGFPVGVTWLPDGRLAMADTHRSRVVILATDGTVLDRIGDLGAEPGQFMYPQRIALDRDGRLYVAEYGTGIANRVQVFEADGTFVRTFGGPAPEQGGLSRPLGVLVRDDGSVLVTDQRAGIVRFDATGTFAGRLTGRAPPEGAHTHGLAGDGRGGLFAAELGLHRLVRVSDDGISRSVFGGPGGELGRFVEPWDVAWYGGYLYVADRGNHRVQRIDPERVDWRDE